MSKPTDLNPKLTNKIASFRKETRTSQAYLAKKIGVSRQTIIDIESGRTIPSVYLALKIALFFDVGVEQLFSLNNQDTLRLMMEH